MKLIKKIFPNYVSKKELKRQLDFLPKQPKFEVKNAKTQKISAKFKTNLIFCLSEEYIYETLSYELAKEIKKVMDVKSGMIITIMEQFI